MKKILKVINHFIVCSTNAELIHAVNMETKGGLWRFEYMDGGEYDDAKYVGVIMV